MSDGTLEGKCPWPGPQPYDADRAERFGGRDREILDLVSRVPTQPLTILTGESGAGKTSLLRAGVIPGLRARRARGDAWIGPVFVLRDWGTKEGASPSDYVVNAIKDVLPTLRAQVRNTEDGALARALEEMERVSPNPLPPTTNLVEKARRAARYVTDLCGSMEAAADSNMRCMILVMDQAEELMGSGLVQTRRRVEAEVIEVLRAILAEGRVRMLVSLREEYVSRLAAVDRHAMTKAQCRIQPLTLRAAKQAIQKSVENIPRVHLELQALDMILASCVTTDVDHGEASPGQPAHMDLDAPVNLLETQAVLFDLYRLAVGIHREEKVEINRRLLEQYQEDTRDLQGESLADKAIHNWIARCWAGPPGDHEDDVKDKLQRSLAKRAATRMAPWLSTWGGFKRPVDETELVFHAVIDDLLVLPNVAKDREGFESRLRRALAEFRKTPAKLESLFPDPKSAPPGTCSGWASEQKWGVRKTARVVTEAAFATLKRMGDQNVLKFGRGEGEAMSRGSPTTGRTFELIHDGLGVPLHNWGRRNASSLEWVLASVVASRGTQFMWEDVTEKNAGGPIRHVSWLGCNLEGAKFSGIAFEHCDLRGSVFLGVGLASCLFRKCNLAGCVFQGGSLNGVSFEACILDSVLVRECDWCDVAFDRGCQLDNATIEKLHLSGALGLDGCSARFAQIKSIGNSGWLNVSSDCNFQNALFDDYDPQWNCTDSGLIKSKDLLT